MKISRIHQLIREGEGLHLDFKYEIADARKMARTFVAFANTAGGKLLIGVNDDGTLSGIKSSEEIFMAEKTAREYCRPAVIFTTKDWYLESKTILEVTIPESKSKPHFALTQEGDWHAWVRVADQNILANDVQVRAWELMNAPEGVSICYSKYEKALLESIEKDGAVTLEHYCSLTALPEAKAKAILSNFMAMGLIEAVFSEDGVVYRISSGFTGE